MQIGLKVLFKTKFLKFSSWHLMHLMLPNLSKTALNPFAAGWTHLSEYINITRSSADNEPVVKECFESLIA